MFRWRWLGRVPYSRALERMKTLWSARCAGQVPDTLLLLEHPPVLTVGKARAREDIVSPPDLLAREGIEVHQTDRGGRVTYHGPGQLVAYPVFGVGTAPHAAALLARRLGEVMLALLEDDGLCGRWDPERPGVWVGCEKVGAVGLRVESGVSRHGFAFNVDPDLTHYRHIVPCGVADRGITSLARLLGHAVPVEGIALRTPRAFERVFGARSEAW
jgi:lipoyl(octanoyl) transferase